MTVTEWLTLEVYLEEMILKLVLCIFIKLLIMASSVLNSYWELNFWTSPCPRSWNLFLAAHKAMLKGYSFYILFISTF